MGKFIGGGPKGAEGFPAGDPKHARLAIGGASRSFHAGNISREERDRIQSSARARLSKMTGKKPTVKEPGKPPGM